MHKAAAAARGESEEEEDYAHGVDDVSGRPTSEVEKGEGKSTGGKRNRISELEEDKANSEATRGDASEDDSRPVDREATPWRRFSPRVTRKATEDEGKVGKVRLAIPTRGGEAAKASEVATPERGREATATVDSASKSKGGASAGTSSSAAKAKSDRSVERLSVTRSPKERAGGVEIDVTAQTVMLDVEVLKDDIFAMYVQLIGESGEAADEC